jgi:hypothetical protein
MEKYKVEEDFILCFRKIVRREANIVTFVSRIVAKPAVDQLLLARRYTKNHRRLVRLLSLRVLSPSIDCSLIFLVVLVNVLRPFKAGVLPDVLFKELVTLIVSAHVRIVHARY